MSKNNNSPRIDSAIDFVLNTVRLGYDPDPHTFNDEQLLHTKYSTLPADLKSRWFALYQQYCRSLAEQSAWKTLGRIHGTFASREKEIWDIAHSPEEIKNIQSLTLKSLQQERSDAWKEKGNPKRRRNETDTEYKARSFRAKYLQGYMDEDLQDMIDIEQNKLFLAFVRGYTAKDYSKVPYNY